MRKKKLIGLAAALFLASPLLMAGGGDFPAQSQRSFVQRTIQHEGGGINWTTVIVAGIGALGSIISGFFGYKAIKKRGKNEDD